MNGKADIVVLDADAAKNAIGELADVLADCVAGGASVNFMLPFGRDDAADFFENVVASVARGETMLFAAKLDGRIVGTVQLGLDTPPNQVHRAEIKKLLVHRAARGQGVGAALMAQAEAEAKKRGRTLLVLDTASDDADGSMRAAAGSASATFRTMRCGRAAGSATRRSSGRRFSATPRPCPLPSRASRACG